MSSVKSCVRNIAGIALEHKHLQPLVRAYTSAVNVIAVRKALTRFRKSFWKNSREAAKAVGLGASTVAKIENIKSWPDYDPGVGIISKVIEGAPLSIGAARLTVSSFFAQIESEPNQSLKSASRQEQDRAAPSLEGLADASPEIDRLASEFAAALVQHVKRGLAPSDGPRSTTRRPKSPRRRPRRPRGHQGS